jgi:hypothetical protein
MNGMVAIEEFSKHNVKKNQGGNNYGGKWIKAKDAQNQVKTKWFGGEEQGFGPSIC